MISVSRETFDHCRTSLSKYFTPTLGWNFENAYLSCLRYQFTRPLECAVETSDQSSLWLGGFDLVITTQTQKHQLSFFSPKKRVKKVYVGHTSKLFKHIPQQVSSKKPSQDVVLLHQISLSPWTLSHSCRENILQAIPDYTSQLWCKCFTTAVRQNLVVAQKQGLHQKLRVINLCVITLAPLSLKHGHPSHPH